MLTDRPWTGFVPQVLLHVQNYFETPLHHLWSLAVEEQFYLLIGLSLPFLARLRLGAGHVLAGLVAVILATWLLRPLVALAGVDPISIQIQTQYRLDGLALGVALALFIPALSRDLCAAGSPPLAHFAGALAAFAALFWLTGRPVPAPASATPWPPSARGWRSSPSTAAATASRLARREAAAILGLYSYPMYVWHNGIGNRITPRLAELAGITSPDLVVIGKYVLSIGLAIVIGSPSNSPFMRLRDRLFARPGPLPVRPSGPAHRIRRIPWRLSGRAISPERARPQFIKA